MTYRLFGLGFGLLFLLVQVGCDSTNTPPYTTGNGGSGGTTNAVCADEGGPVVEILTPVAVTDPGSPDLITVPDFRIECQVVSSGSPIDDTSVEITVYGAEGDTVTPVVSNGGSSVFEATASVADFDNGALRIVCEASNSGPRGACSGAEVNTLLDLGPGIEMLNPAASGVVLSGGVEVRYTLAQLPVTEGDTVESVPADWQVVVAGAPISSIFESQTDTTVTFSAPVSFDDPTLYETPLDGMYQMSVSASNGRGVTRTVTLDFAVDAEGPTIEILQPELGSVIGGATSVVANVTDPSGVDSTRVNFYIGSRKFDMAPVPGTGGQFAGSFDANQYDETIGEVTIDVIAADVVNNESVASVVVELDTQPPVLEMNPPVVREGKEDGAELTCSVQFNPVGDEAIGDGELVGTRSQIRARVEDKGNFSASYKAGLDFDSVQVWILRGTDQALVVDSNDEDTTCDSLNPAVLPGNQAGNIAAVAIDLVGLPPTGTPDYFPGQSFGGAPEYAACFSGEDTEPGETVCNTTSIPRIIPDNDEPSGTTPAIFVKGPIIPFYCMGDPFDWQTALDGIEGPGCMAVIASDERGNTSVSEPLRVCFTKTDPTLPLPPGHPCLGFSYDSDTCTDGCIPAKFRENELIGPFE